MPPETPRSNALNRGRPTEFHTIWSIVSIEPIGSRAMPVPFARCRVHRVARAYLEHGATAGLDAANAIGHVDGLAQRVDVPRVASTRGKAHQSHPDARRRLANDDPVDVRVTGERFCRCLVGGLLGEDLHRVLRCVNRGAECQEHAGPGHDRDAS